MEGQNLYGLHLKRVKVRAGAVMHRCRRGRSRPLPHNTRPLSLQGETWAYKILIGTILPELNI